MATVRTTRKTKPIEYPTSDGRPMSETDFHYVAITLVREMLKEYFADKADTYVSGNLLLFYEEGNRRKHISPDVFVVKGVDNYQRPNYLIWEEGKGPDVIIEVTSKTKRKEDLQTKYLLYQDVLRVPEYFLFDPLAEYLKPPLQGHRLKKGRYEPIKAVRGRLPSKVLGLQLERNGQQLRLYDPKKSVWLPTFNEALALARREAEAKVAQLQQELDEMRRRLDAGRRSNGAGSKGD